MLIKSTRFGEIEVNDDLLVVFPDGLPGFSDEKQFAILPQGKDSPFAFLQSAANPDLTFVIVDPFAFFKDYNFELSDEIAQNMNLSEKNPPHVYNIVTLKDGIEQATANLLAPLIINPETKEAVQVILERTCYTTRHKLFPNGLPEKAGEGGR